MPRPFFFRNRFWEALEILRTVLSINPTHLVARTLRMVVYHNLAIEAPSYAAAEALYLRAKYEALFVEENCDNLSEDFYCDYGLCCQGQAMLMVRHMRQGQSSFPDLQDAEQSRKTIFLALDKAEDLFIKGMTVSPSSVRSAYLLCAVRMIKSILKNDNDIFSNPDKPIDSKPEIIRQLGRDFYLQRGFLRHKFPPQQQYDFLIRSVYRKTKIHDASISSKSYRPNSLFGAAIVLWDFLPFVRTAAIAKRVVQIIRDAKDMAQSMAKNDLGIYSGTTTFFEVVPANEFSMHMDKALKMIEDYVGRDLSTMDDQEVIESNGDLSSMLMTLNF